MVKVGISAMLGEDFRAFCKPILQSHQVDIIEWSFDTAWGHYKISPWLHQVLKDYSGRNSLLGHGVNFSLLSANEEKYHNSWLERFSIETKRLNYTQISEHLGFMRAGRFRRNTPLPLPYNKSSINIGLKNIAKLAIVSPVKIGLENNAFAFCKDDILNQGKFLNILLKEVEGFLVLDLHNLYCQIVNFDLKGFEKILYALPLERLSEIHISGGSRFDFRNSNLVRDSHDGKIPKLVIKMLKFCLQNCKNLEYVIFEHIGTAMGSKELRLEVQKEYLKVLNMARSSS